MRLLLGYRMRHLVSLAKWSMLHLKYLILVAAFLLCPPTRSLTVQAIGLAAFWALVYFTLKQSTILSFVQITSLTKYTLGLIAMTTLVFIGYYLWEYEFIPTWDTTNYYRMTLQFNEGLGSSVHETLLNCFYSVSMYDYNQLLSWILSLPARVFPSWAGFMFCSIVLFNIPAAMIVSLFVCSKVKRLSAKRCDWLTPLCFLGVLLVPTALRPGLGGLVDAPAYVLMATSMTVLMDERMPVSRSLQVFGSLCLCGSFLLRRYILYAAMGLALGTVLYWLAKVIMRPRGERVALLQRLLSALAVVLGVVVMTALVFPGFYYMSLFGGQTTAYQSWTLIDSLPGKVLDVIGQVGPLWFVLAIACLVVLVARRDSANRECVAEVLLTCFSCFVSVVFSLLAFWQVQDLSIQHWYVFLAPLTTALALPFLALCASLGRHLVRVLAIGACSASVAGLLGGLSLLDWLPISAGEKLSAILPWDVHAPIVQSDVSEKRRMTELLERETKGEGLVYFACASFDLNGTVPLGCVLPDSTESPFPVASADVDSRDGFNTAFFDADFVVTSDPVSIHLRAENEMVVVTLNSLVSDAESFVGRHYEPVATFELDGGVEATVYRKISEFTDEEVIRLRDYFDAIYPDLPELFRDRFDRYLDAKGDANE